MSHFPEFNPTFSTLRKLRGAEGCRMSQKGRLRKGTRGRIPISYKGGGRLFVVSVKPVRPLGDGSEALQSAQGAAKDALTSRTPRTASGGRGAYVVPKTIKNQKRLPQEIRK